MYQNKKAVCKAQNEIIVLLTSQTKNEIILSCITALSLKAELSFHCCNLIMLVD